MHRYINGVNDIRATIALNDLLNADTIFGLVHYRNRGYDILFNLYRKRSFLIFLLKHPFFCIRPRGLVGNNLHWRAKKFGEIA